MRVIKSAPQQQDQRCRSDRDDSGRPELHAGARSRYTGTSLSVLLERDGTDPQAAVAKGTMTIRDKWDRIAYTGPGVFDCDM